MAVLALASRGTYTAITTMHVNKEAMINKNGLHLIIRYLRFAE